MDAHPPTPQHGIVFLISAPPGAGKTTLINALVEKDRAHRYFSVSCTTRDPRDKEKNGREYRFVTEEMFRDLIKAGHFIEHTNFDKGNYGTPRKALMTAINAGIDVFIDVDSNGIVSLSEKLAENGIDFVRVLVMPGGRKVIPETPPRPNDKKAYAEWRGHVEEAKATMEKRMIERGDKKADVKRRAADYDKVIEAELELPFDYVIDSNGTPKKTLAEAETLITSVHAPQTLSEDNLPPKIGGFANRVASEKRTGRSLVPDSPERQAPRSRKGPPTEDSAA
jgi:guanylate kinase